VRKLWLLLLILPVMLPASGQADWNVQGNVNALYTDGNANTFSGGLGLSARHQRPRLTLALGADGTYGMVKYQGGEFIENTNFWHTWFKVNYYLIKDKKVFGWFDNDLTGDAYKGFWLRVENATGLGYSLFKRKELSWDIRAGVNYTWDKLARPDAASEETTDAVNAMAATDFAWTFREGMDWTWQVRYLTDLDESDNYRVEGGTALTTKLNKLMSLKQSVSFQYNNSPLAVEKVDPYGRPITPRELVPAERLDVTVSFSLVMSFTHSAAAS
jgi:putative salt-induced outer membrane protein YdiY